MLLLEGDRLVDDGLSAGLGVELLLVAVDRPERAAELRAAGQRPLMVEHFVLDRVSKVKNSPGVLALVRVPPVPRLEEYEPTDLAAGRAPLVVVAAGISNPINVGALVRSAEAAGASALVNVATTGAHLWSPRALRGSMGSLLRLPVYTAADAVEARTELLAKGFQLVRPAVRGGTNYRTFDWTPPTALWIGSETDGDDGDDSDEVAPAEFAEVSIPMTGTVDSLNVTVASAVLLFAAGRSEP